MGMESCFPFGSEPFNMFIDFLLFFSVSLSLYTFTFSLRFQGKTDSQRNLCPGQVRPCMAIIPAIQNTKV
jgi:hypothetical protein